MGSDAEGYCAEWQTPEMVFCAIVGLHLDLLTAYACICLGGLVKDLRYDFGFAGWRNITEDASCNPA